MEYSHVRILVLMVLGMLYASCDESVCDGKDCSVDLPLVSKFDVPLKTTIDMTLMNQQIRALIKEEVKNEVKNALDTLLNETFSKQINQTEEILQSEIQKSMTEFELSQKMADWEGLQSEMSYLKYQMDSIIKDENQNVIVAVSSCSTQTYIKRGDEILFPSIRFSSGITDKRAYKSTGFKCEYPGMYLISVTIATVAKKSGFNVRITKNNTHTIMFIFFRELRNSGFHTGTGVILTELSENDTIDMEPSKDIIIYAPSSCVSIVKLS